MTKPKEINDLIIARHERGLSRKQVSNFLRGLGYTGTSAIEEYERGRAHPPLLTALALEIIYRKPAAFLWPQQYQRLRSQIRALEAELPDGNTESMEVNHA